MKHLVWILVMVLFAALAACGASSVKTPADPSRAWNAVTRQCDPYGEVVSPEDFYACQQLLASAEQANKAAAAAVASSTAPTSPAAPPSSAVAWQPSSIHAPPAPAALPVLTEGAIVFPTGTGSTCDVPGGKTITIWNHLPKIVEVRSDYLAPLACDAVSSLVPAGLGNEIGKPRPNMVIPPAIAQGKPSSATFVVGYRVVNGKLVRPAELRVIYVPHDPSLGPFLPAPEDGQPAVKTYNLSAVAKGYNQTLFGGDFGMYM